MSDAPTIQAKLVVAGRDWEPEDCTEATGIVPTRIWRQTRQDLRDRPDFETEAWIVASHKLPAYEIDTFVNNVLDHIWQGRTALIEFVSLRHLAVVVGCDVVVEKDQPVFELLPKTIERIAELNASFAIDLIGVAPDDTVND